MFDDKDIIKNIQTIYDSNTSLRVLKDFERVIDELNLYVYKNWMDGELVRGPDISRHWVECEFMWPKKKMPDPTGGSKLLDYGCKISYRKGYLQKPRKIEHPNDIRPNSKKGIIDKHPIWIVNIKIPKELMFKIFKGSARGANEKNVDIGSFYKDYDIQDMGTKLQSASVTPQDIDNEPAA